MNKIFSVVSLGLLTLAVSGHTLSEQGGSCVLEPKRPVMTVDDFLERMPEEERVSKEEMVRAFELLPRTKVWETSTQRALLEKIEAADLAVLGSIGPYADNIWSSSDFREVASLSEVVLNIDVEKVYRINASGDEANASYEDREGRLELIVSTKLLYIPEYGVSVEQLRAEIDDHLSKYRELWTQLRRDFESNSLTQDQLNEARSDLRKQQMSDKFGGILGLPGRIEVAASPGPAYFLCGFGYVTTEKEYLFFLREVEPNVFRLDGSRAILPGQLAEELEYVLSEMKRPLAE